MKKRIVITGAAGTVGTVAASALRDDYHLALLDINSEGSPDGEPGQIFPVDVAVRPEALAYHLSGQHGVPVADMVFHFAWNSLENWRSSRVLPGNKTAVENVLSLAKECGVPRVVLASSIHADGRYATREGPYPLVAHESNPRPDSMYGVSKLYVEGLGRYYAHKFELDVICIRFGGVSLDNVPRNEPLARQIWLHTDDLASLIRICANASVIAGKFELFYAVSANSGKVHSTRNHFGWAPVRNFAQLQNV